MPVVYRNSGIMSARASKALSVVIVDGASLERALVSVVSNLCPTNWDDLVAKAGVQPELEDGMKFAASLGANRVFPSSPDEVITGYGDVKAAGIIPNPNNMVYSETPIFPGSVNGSMQRTKMNSSKSLKAYTQCGSPFGG